MPFYLHMRRFHLVYGKQQLAEACWTAIYLVEETLDYRHLVVEFSELNGNQNNP